jgi:hypothetical protein
MLNTEEIQAEAALLHQAEKNRQQTSATTTR